MKRIYIAHPLTGDGSSEWGNMDRNVERYLNFVALATNQGHAVISWVHHFLTHKRNLTTGDDHFYLERDAKLLEMADELWVCGDPSASGGTRFEINLATELGIPIRQEDEWMDSSFWPDPRS